MHCYVLQHYISLGTAKLKPQQFFNHFHIYLAQTGARQFGSRTIYTVPCLGMDLVILIFFLCLCSLSPLWRLREEREGGGKKKKKKKTSLTEAQSIISQVFDWSDCKRSRQFPRALDWDGLELARNKTQFSRSEETAVLNKTRQRMQKKRLPAEDKVESWLLFSFSLHSPVTHSLSYSLVF